MSFYLLDTNMVSHFVKGHRAVVSTLLSKPLTSIFISAITEGELRFGLAKRAGSTKFATPIEQFIRRAASLPWDDRAAESYGTLRARVSSAPAEASAPF